MNHVSSSPIIPLHSRLPSVQLAIVDRPRLLAEMLLSRRFERRDSVWMVALPDGGRTVVTLDDSVLTFTYTRESKRIAIGDQLIEATRQALAWPPAAA